MHTKLHLAKTAEALALLPFHGTTQDEPTNLMPIIKLFPKWSLEGAENCWCAAFVYYCCVMAGFSLPYSPDECITCSLAGCGGWEEFALGDKRLTYTKDISAPNIGDIVLFDRVATDKEHDHIGIVTGVSAGFITCAEGNIANTNRSGTVKRPIDGHIRAYITLPDGYSYR